MSDMVDMIYLDGNSLTVDDVVAISRSHVKVALTEDAKKAIQISRDIVDRHVANHEAIYGLSTGFGKFVNVAISEEDLDKLQYCEVMGRTLLFHRQDGVVMDSAGRLDDLCEQLKDYDCFIRCHRSYLVNLAYVQNISSKAVTMCDGTELPIPHGKYSELKDRFFDYFFQKNQTILG